MGDYEEYERLNHEEKRNMISRMEVIKRAFFILIKYILEVISKNTSFEEKVKKICEEIRYYKFSERIFLDFIDDIKKNPSVKIALEGTYQLKNVEAEIDPGIK